jgi:hypothetical protein
MTGYESMPTKCEEQSVAVWVRALAMVLIIAVGCADSVPPPMPPEPHLDQCMSCLKIDRQLKGCDEIKARAQGFHWTSGSVRQCCDEGLSAIGEAVRMINEARAAGCPETDLLMDRANQLSHFFLLQKNWYK